uniref:Uncharacterized protein n=1 Tax=Chromera velia CCMP2878 TaxID=1169474 RepID=A0A0G4FUD2_9ALVE|eukprot:Cvel_18823.t1-p1 / transcript=Cvel_18823.t1 / gene=Cvel_18823 / organism=Chromera_velia_CCMP2878 / gene_product=WD repeat-containing protein 65, putative / transcript_product=WD repeat-containing protein 65, putative / location=Cvel_scaffold1581:17545-29166(+) / protein_length=1385 / sequence_SO=supercontig / SO=protein_coding / is_pseudo=false
MGDEIQAEEGLGPAANHGPAVSLSHRHIFGLKPDVNSLLHFAEENQIIYPAGHNAVLYSTDHKAQKVFPGHEGSEGITALALSSSKRYLAVAERTERAMVTIWDLVNGKKRRQLSYSECEATEFVWLAFSSESKFLVTLGGPPDWMLIYWSWDKGKVLASVKASQGSELSDCSFNPTDSQSILLCGESVLRTFRLMDGQLKSTATLGGGSRKEREQLRFTCHCWLADDRLIACSEDGQIQLYDNNGEFRATLACSPHKHRACMVVAAISKGFVTGGVGGVIRIFEKSEDLKEFYKRAGSDICVDGTPGVFVRSLAVSPSEEILGIACSNHQLYSLSLTTSDLLKSDDAPTADYLLTAFHSSPILGLDVCVRKPLVVTCSGGSDKTVRVWNYQERTCELTRHFNEEAYSVAFHPSGFHVLVGFSDKLRLMNVLMDDLKTYKEIPIKACRECRFSNGGHLFAAVNSTTIQIFRTYTGEPLWNLRGHNSKVRSVCWTADDTSLVSCGQDGAVYEFSIVNEGKRVSDFVQKGVNLSSVAVYSDPSAAMGKEGPQNSLFAVGSDKMLKEIHKANMRTFTDARILLGQIALPASAKALFATIAEPERPSSLRVYRFPLHGEYVDYQCHSGPSLRLRVSFDDQFVFSASEDGTLCVFDVREKDKVVTKRDREHAIDFADEILVTRLYLDEKQAQMLELERQVDELTNQMDFQLRNRDTHHKEKMAELEDKYQQEVEQERTKYELLREEKNDMEMEYEDNLRNMEELHQKQMQELEASFQAKTMAELKQHQSLMTAKDKEIGDFKAHLKEMKEAFERKLNETTDEFGDKVRELQQDKRNLQEQKETALKNERETLRQLEEDADKEIEEVKEQYEEKINIEKIERNKLLCQANMHKKTAEEVQRALEKEKDAVREKESTISKLKQEIDKLLKESLSMRNEIRERDLTIGGKEQRIYDLKKLNQELEKFKFVLDYKIKELKAQIDPKNDEIALMKKCIQDMDAELEEYHRKNKNFKLKICELETKQNALLKEIQDQRKSLTDSNNLIKRMKDEIFDCAQHIQEPKALKNVVTGLYKKYVKHEVKKVEFDTDIQKEANRQRDYLERSVESLKRKLSKDSEVHRQDNMKIMQENVVLIREINELRRELNHLRHERQQAKLHLQSQAGGQSGPQGINQQPSYGGGQPPHAQTHRPSTDRNSPPHASGGDSLMQGGGRSQEPQEVQLVEEDEDAVLQEQLAAVQQLGSSHPPAAAGAPSEGVPVDADELPLEPSSQANPEAEREVQGGVETPAAPAEDDVAEASVRPKEGEGVAPQGAAGGEEGGPEGAVGPSEVGEGGGGETAGEVEGEVSAPAAEEAPPAAPEGEGGGEGEAEAAAPAEGEGGAKEGEGEGEAAPAE